MSLHPGERGVCPKHGEYDEYCDKCADEKKAERRERLQPKRG